MPALYTSVHMHPIKIRVDIGMYYVLHCERTTNNNSNLLPQIERVENAPWCTSGQEVRGKTSMAHGGPMDGVGRMRVSH